MHKPVANRLERGLVSMSILQIKTAGESPRLQAVCDAAHGIVEGFMINKLYDTYQRRFGGGRGWSKTVNPESVTAAAAANSRRRRPLGHWA